MNPMKLRGVAAWLLVASTAGGGVAVVAGQAQPAQNRRSADRPYNAPKAPWGDPDLQGTYTNKDENGIPLERPGNMAGKQIEEIDDSELAELVRERNQRAEATAAGIGGADTGAGPTHWYEHYGAKNSRAWMVVDPPDGRIPAQTPEAVKRIEARNAARKGRGPADSWEDRSLYDRCISRGLPGSMMPAIYGNAYEIVQAPGVVAIQYEMIHETRIIPLDGRGKLPTSIRSFMGDARGRWDGDTLVVETTNFDPRSAYRNANGDTLTLIERFKPVGAGKIEWSITVNDPTTWVRPWTFAMNLTQDESQDVFEYGCHEGNLGLRNILSAARAEEAAAKK
jgi:hypothetical protein